MLALMDISCPPAEARAAVLAEAGYRASAGIASNKLLAKLLNGRFKVSKTRHGYLFEDATYSVFVTAREDLTAELYPPFNTDQKGA